MTPHIRYLTGMASALVTFWFATDAALACACCSHRAARYVEVEKLSESRLGEIERMTFAEEAFVAEGAGDHPVEIQNLGTKLPLAVAQTKKEIVFSFRDQVGRAAALVLVIPETIRSSRSIHAAVERTKASAPISGFHRLDAANRRTGRQTHPLWRADVRLPLTRNSVPNARSRRKRQEIDLTAYLARAEKEATYA